jgi:hypothetical protein
MYSILNCDDVARYTEFYVGYLRFNVTSLAMQSVFKKSFTMMYQMLLCVECYINVYT